MCCRCYVEYLKDKELKKIYDLVSDKEGIKTEGELYPGDNVVIVAKGKNMNISAFKMKWGYTFNEMLVFNARSESLFEKEAFVDGIKNRRCVIPVNCYFEWKKDNKVKYVFKDKDSTILYLLGIYRFEKGAPVFTILTKDASSSLSSIHDRMPVMVKSNEVRKWLTMSSDVSSIIKNSVEDLYFEPYKE
ncbi:SOS response-associated peptidase family protein [bacterium]|nr:SOS response-associated peptidase family protein [bacterium]